MALPTVLVPGLLASPLLFAPVVPALWQFGAVSIADTLHDDTIAGIAARLLADAPPRFALGGLSMGGYVALEVLRQAPERVARLALIDTSARPDTPDATATRERQIEVARSGKLLELAELSLPQLVDPHNHDKPGLRQTLREMAAQVGVDAYITQQRAIIGRIDSRPHLPAISCPTVVIVGDGDRVTPPAFAQELASAIANATLEIVERCGHISTLEQPEAVIRALTAWHASAATSDLGT